MKLKLIIFAAILLVSSNIFAQTAANQLKEAVAAKNYEAAVVHAAQAVKENPEDVNVLLLAGDVFFEMDKNEEALNAYQKAYNEDKKNLTAVIKYGRLLSLTGRHNESISLLNEAVNKNQKDPKVRLELANSYLRIDSISKAELLITYARELDRKSPEAFTALGDLYMQQKIYELARQNFEEALNLDANNIDARVKLATSYFRLANQESDEELRSELYNRSLDEWNKVTQQDPQNARAFYEQGRLFYFGGQYENAARSLNNFVLLRPSGSLGRWYLAQSLEKLGNCDSAITHLEIVAKEIDTVSKKANYLIALCLFDSKNYKGAIEQFNKISMDTTIAVIDLQRLGQAYLLTNDTLKALEEWEKAVQEDKFQSCRIMNQMGVLYQKLGMWDKSINIFNTKINTSECNDEYQHIVYYYLGLSHIQSGKPENSIEPLKKSIEVNPQFLYSRVSLADAYAAMQNYDAADSVFKNTIEIAKKDTAENAFVLAQAFGKLAGMNLDRKKFNEVAKIGEEWASVFQNEPIAYLYAAIAYHNLSNGKQACTNYRKVLKIDPKNTTASKNLKMLEDANQCQ